ncbi:MAG: MFS transporter [Gemmatimonadota bacterium]
MSRQRLPRTVIALSLVSLLTDVSSEMIYPLVPLFLTTVIGAGALTLGAIEGTAETVASLLKFASGWWSDRLGRRKALVTVGYLISSVLRPLTGLATSAAHVFAIRVGDRIGKGIRTSPRDAILADAVEPAVRGRAFGFHQSADHLGAVIGPCIAFALLQWADVALRTVFLLAAIPAAGAVAVLVFLVREEPAGRRMREGKEGDARESSPKARGGVPPGATPPAPPMDQTMQLAQARLGGRFYAYIGVVLLFTLGNSTDAFLLLRARDLGVSAALIPILWAAFHVVKSLTATPAGALSDRVGRRSLIVGGWLVYAAVYLGFAHADGQGLAWALFLLYGVYFGLTEGVQKALVADLVPPVARGRAFGWYNLALGLGALPASLLFGVVWDRRGAPAAFTLGSAIAGLAALLMLLTVPRRVVAKV